jgi:hypothetical protein
MGLGRKIMKETNYSNLRPIVLKLEKTPFIPHSCLYKRTNGKEELYQNTTTL